MIPNFKYSMRAHFHVQSIKVSPVTIACKAAKLSAFFHLFIYADNQCVWTIAVASNVQCMYRLGNHCYQTGTVREAEMNQNLS